MANFDQIFAKSHFFIKTGNRTDCFSIDGATWRRCAADQKQNYLRSYTPKEQTSIIADLTVEDSNLESSHLLATRDGDVIDLDSSYSRNKGGDCSVSLLSVEEARPKLITTRLGASLVSNQKDQPNPIRDHLEDRIKDPQLYKFLMHYMVRILHGDHGLKMIFAIFNTRKNTGKSLLIHVLLKMFGDYALKISSSFLERSNEEKLLKVLYLNRFARIVITDELDSARATNDSVLKSLTGGDAMPGPYRDVCHLHYVLPRTFLVDTNIIPDSWLGDESELASRVFTIPYGRPVLVSERRKDYSAFLTRQEHIDTFFTYLLEEFA